jgi:LemA protein
MALTPLNMTKKRKQLFGGIAAVIVVLLAVITSYNGLVNKETRVDQASADLEVQLQRRFDLIPNLVSAVEGAMTQERTIFTALAEARSKYAGATSSNDKIAAASQVESALSRLLVVVENYPTLQRIHYRVQQGRSHIPTFAHLRALRFRKTCPIRSRPR